MNIKVEITGRIATLQDDPILVCGNSTDTVTFTFDDEWSGYANKTARFVYKSCGKLLYQDVLFSGDTANIPAIFGINKLHIGVYAKDIITTTPAVVECKKSIKCDTGIPEPPSEDVYAEILALFEDINTKLDDDIGDAVEQWLNEHPEAIPTPPTTGGFVTPQMFGAKGDGKTDDTDAIQQALNSSRIVYIPDGTYLIKCNSKQVVVDKTTYNYGLMVPSNTKVYLDGNATLKAISNGLTNYSMVGFLGVSNSGIYGGNIQGDRDTHDYTASGTHEKCGGTRIANSSYITIKDVHYYEITGGCIGIGGGYGNCGGNPTEGYLRVHHVVIDGCILDGARQNNISFIDGEYVQIINNIIKNAGTVNGVSGAKCGIDVEPNFWETDPNHQRAENTIIQGNTFIGNYGTDITLNGRRTTNFIIDNNTFICNENCATDHYCVYSKSNWYVTITNNIFNNTTANHLNAIQTNRIPADDIDRKNLITISNNQLLNMGLYLGGDDIKATNNILVNGIISAIGLRNSIISENTITSGQVLIDSFDEDEVPFTGNIKILNNCFDNCELGIRSRALNGTNGVLNGITIKGNVFTDCIQSIAVTANSGDLFIDTNEIYSTFDIEDENYKCTNFAIVVDGYSSVSIINNIINKTAKIIDIKTRTETNNLNISNNIISAGNIDQSVRITGKKDGAGEIVPFTVRFANNSIKSLAKANTFMYLVNLSGCRVMNNEIDSQSNYRPIHSASSMNTKYFNNLTSGAIHKADTDTETGTTIIS